MYLSYYKLVKKPFQISTDPDFLWLGKQHREALSLLKHGVQENNGFLLLTGDVGTGKTTLINAFVNSLGKEVISARVSDPGLTKLDFIKYIAEMFRLETAFETKSEFLLLFTKFLEQADRDRKKVLLIIDEAQNITDVTLEEIRLLSNIERQDKKLLNIFLVGQNDFYESLEKYVNRALRQRLTLSYTLQPFELDETRDCIKHRLAVAGCSREIFTSDAVEAIHTISEGFPRLINIICDHALLLGYQEEQETIGEDIVWRYANDLHLNHLSYSYKKDDHSNASADLVDDVTELSPSIRQAIGKASQPIAEKSTVGGPDRKEKTTGHRVFILLLVLGVIVSGFFVVKYDGISVLSTYFTDNRKTTTAPTQETKSETTSFTQAQPREEVAIDAKQDEAETGEEIVAVSGSATNKNEDYIQISTAEPYEYPEEPVAQLTSTKNAVLPQVDSGVSQEFFEENSVKVIEQEAGKIVELPIFFKKSLKNKPQVVRELESEQIKEVVELQTPEKEETTTPGIADNPPENNANGTEGQPGIDAQKKTVTRSPPKSDKQAQKALETVPVPAGQRTSDLPTAAPEKEKPVSNKDPSEIIDWLIRTEPN